MDRREAMEKLVTEVREMLAESGQREEVSFRYVVDAERIGRIRVRLEDLDALTEER